METTTRHEHGPMIEPDGAALLQSLLGLRGGLSMSAKRFQGLWLGLFAMVAAGCGEETFRAPPDCEGIRIVAYGRRALDGGTSDIFLFDYLEGGFRALPNLNDGALPDIEPAISVDGRFIAFQREPSLTESDVHVYDRCQDLVLPQAGVNTVLRERQPAFSGNVQRLAFVRDTLPGPRVRLYDGVVDRLVDLPALAAPAGAYADSSPSLNADGTVIAFVSSRNGNNDIFVYDLLADTLRNLPDLATPDNDIDPSLTPDGHYLVFASDRPGGEGGLDVYMYDLSTHTFITLPGANSPETDRAPSISPNANRIAFESDRSPSLGGSDLYLHTRSIPATERLLASGPNNEVRPAIVWQ